MKNLIIILILGLCCSMNAQTDSIEIWRSKGYEARTEGQFEQAIGYYSNILDVDSEDYDARLALARLYSMSGNCERALDYYHMIYGNDSTDVEAMNGFAKCYMRWGEMDRAISWAETALKHLPDHVPQYLLLAKTYAWDGQLQKAIETYRDAAEIDDTYAEIWSGIGQMYYWKGRPKTAVKYYKKALALDPENWELKEEYTSVRSDLAWNVSAGLHYIREIEESYEIDALVQKYGLSKRVGDHFAVRANFLLDRSDRDYTGQREDVSRWFDNTWVRLDWYGSSHRFSIFGGASVSDDRITTYGGSWTVHANWDALKLENTITGKYDYFYYWNEVGKTGLEESLQLSFKRARFRATLMLGEIDEAQSRKFPSDSYEIRNNPYLGYSLSLDYAVIERPKVRLGVRHSYLDYEYQSSDYYSPYDRRLTGFMASLYHRWSDWYLYTGASYTPGTEEFRYRTGSMGQGRETGTVDVTNWTADFEIGYEFDPVTLSLGGSRFYNPYYESLTAFLNIQWVL